MTETKHPPWSDEWIVDCAEWTQSVIQAMKGIPDPAAYRANVERLIEAAKAVDAYFKGHLPLTANLPVDLTDALAAMKEPEP